MGYIENNLIPGEQVPVLIERQLLRVSQAGGEHFEFRSVGIAAEHGSPIGIDEPLALLGHDVETAIADAEIQPPVGPERQAVQVVPAERDADAESRQQRLTEIGLAVAVFVAQQPQMRDIGVPDVAAARCGKWPG